MNKIDILIVGVGGQGVITASEIVSEVGIRKGYDVKKSELHGMSQRGGSVSSDIRFDREKVYSPTIAKNSADFVIGFELLETYRALPYIKENGVVITSDYKLDPMTVSSGTAHYPKKLEEKIKNIHENTYCFDQKKIIEKIGNPKAINVFIIGGMAAHIEDIEKKLWEEVIRDKFPEKFVDLNIRAFREGLKLAK